MKQRSDDHVRESNALSRRIDEEEFNICLAATLLAGTSNISKVKDKIKVSENETGHIVIEQMND